MGYRINGVGAFGYSVNWERVEGDKDVARAVIGFLEDRRLLFGDRHVEDEGHCVTSALEIRKFLTEQLANAKPGKSLDASPRAMRSACRKFIDAAGPQGRNFQRRHWGYETDPFGLALGDLRTAIGMQVALVADQYDISVEDDLLRILPPEDKD